MSGSPLSIKLNCTSWQQLSAIHSRDLCRAAFFLKTQKPPVIGTLVRISLTLPSGTTLELQGAINAHIGPGELDGRGPGIDVALHKMPQSVLWLIESALTSAGLPPAGMPSTGDAALPSPTPAEAQPDSSPSLEDGDEWVKAKAELIQALWQELAGMSKLNAFQLLDLPYTANDSEVRAAFQKLSKKYHPDRFTRYESFEIRELANEVFILLRDAYRSLADQGGREKLLAAVQAATPGVSPNTPRSTPQRTPSVKPVPSTAPRAAIATPPASPKVTPRPVAPQPLPPPLTPAPQDNAEDADWDMASRPISIASGTAAQSESKKDDDRLEFALRFLDSGQYEQALRILRVEARKDPNNLQALAGVELASGRLALADGDRMEATERFEAALEIDPNNERAAREIAEMRRYATSQRRGLLSKLMKKV